MSTASIRVDIAAGLAHLLAPTGQDLHVRVHEALILELFQEGVVSSGRAAILLCISKDAFLDLLRERGLPYLDLTYDDLLEDVRVATEARVHDSP